ncbi:MAG: hypothetical protein QGF23_01825 [Dehalococcoidales bacterium]|jgi:DNA-directed RNA polymerase subunit M/transcription elongation factor TFIIS/ribosomal protein S27AE|nr:hypothetical protein [Dehalococcoidales bacterium]
MVVWKIKSCSRCGGDTFLDMDGTTSFDHCLQCGYMRQGAKELCPVCNSDMFFDIIEDNWVYRCYQCNYSDKDKHTSINQKYERVSCAITGSNTLTADWATHETADRKPGRPKGSKDKRKRRKRRRVLN